MTLSLQTASTPMHDARLLSYLSACGIPEHQHQVLLNATRCTLTQLRTQDEPAPSLEQAMTVLRKEITSFRRSDHALSETQTSTETRLSLYLNRDASSPYRGWSMPSINRSRMVPADYTPKIIKKLRRLSGRRPSTQHL